VTVPYRNCVISVANPCEYSVCANCEGECANPSRIRVNLVKDFRECVANVSVNPRIRRESENLSRIREPIADLRKCVANPANPCELVRIRSRTFANPSRICANLVENFRESVGNPWISDANLRSLMQNPRMSPFTSPIKMRPPSRDAFNSRPSRPFRDATILRPARYRLEMRSTS
jgi:hypothetical protein